MQIVINISEESYKNIKEQVDKRDYPDMQIGRAIVDGKPLPKGHWIFDKERLGYWTSTCSECEHIYHGNEVLIYKPKFCANCGARMFEPQESEDNK